MDRIFTHIWRNKFSFLGVFFVVFSLTYMVFMAIDMLPESPTEETAEESMPSTASTTEEEMTIEQTRTAEPVTEPDTSEAVVQNTEIGSLLPVSSASNPPVTPSDEVVLPTSIIIPRLDKILTVLNPTSRTIADLDEALLNGVVRHPDSANLAQEGNVFILGHSSYLPNVLNRNFQAFNGIQNLQWGDTIEVLSENAVFQYRVEKVYRARAQDVTVPIAGTGNKLTLATCNSFGSVDDRYIVEAKRVDVREL